MKPYLIMAVVAIAFVVGSDAVAQGMSSANYRIPSSVIASGGATMTSTNYTLTATVGEPVVGPSTGVNVKLNAGFIATLMSVIGTKGDVNRDGVIDATDVNILLKITGGLKNSDDLDVDFINGDVNPPTPDGLITLEDAVRLLRYVNGLYPGGL